MAKYTEEANTEMEEFYPRLCEDLPKKGDTEFLMTRNGV